MPSHRAQAHDEDTNLNQLLVRSYGGPSPHHSMGSACGEIQESTPNAVDKFTPPPP
jgi:hypothetical protein